jgi:hypothetical protein
MKRDLCVMKLECRMNLHTSNTAFSIWFSICRIPVHQFVVWSKSQFKVLILFFLVLFYKKKICRNTTLVPCHVPSSFPSCAMSRTLRLKLVWKRHVITLIGNEFSTIVKSLQY